MGVGILVASDDEYVVWLGPIYRLEKTDMTVSLVGAISKNGYVTLLRNRGQISIPSSPHGRSPT
jgi:hypothetical protein